MKDRVRCTWHLGGLPGTLSFLVRRHDGVAYSVLFNQRVSGTPLNKFDQALNEAVDRTAYWPDDDLFPDYTSTLRD